MEMKAIFLPSNSTQSGSCVQGIKIRILGHNLGGNHRGGRRYEVWSRM